jgi:hypothetical protein
MLDDRPGFRFAEAALYEGVERIFVQVRVHEYGRSNQRAAL